MSSQRGLINNRFEFLKKGNRRYADAQALEKAGFKNRRGLPYRSEMVQTLKSDSQTELRRDTDSNLNVDFF